VPGPAARISRDISRGIGGASAARQDRQRASGFRLEALGLYGRMTPLFWLILVAAVVAIAALTGLKPKEGRHVARTQLMGVARVVLILVLIAVGYVLYRSSVGP
jgi:hypothetical protein